MVVLVIVGAVGVSGYALAAGGKPAAPTRPPGVARSSAGVPSRCPHRPVDPRRALPLPANALGPAADAALRYFEAPRNDISGLHQGAIAQAADRVQQPARSTAGDLCGPHIAARTVTVSAFFPRGAATGSASLSFGVMLVSRFAPNRYLVWFQRH